jgi:hypothetical protein
MNQRVIDNIQAQLRIEPDFLMMPCKGIVKIPVFTIQIYAYVNPSSSIARFYCSNVEFCIYQCP